MCPNGRDVERADLGTLVAGSQRSFRNRVDDVSARGVASVSNRATQVVLLVIGVGILEPGARETKVQMECIQLSRLVIDAVKDVFLIALVVQCLKLGWIQKPPGVQAVDGDKFPQRSPPYATSKPAFTVPKLPYDVYTLPVGVVTPIPERVVTLMTKLVLSP